MTARAPHWVRVWRRGLPPRQEWRAPLLLQYEELRILAEEYELVVGDVVRTWIIHRARVALGERAFASSMGDGSALPDSARSLKTGETTGKAFGESPRPSGAESSRRRRSSATKPLPEAFSDGGPGIVRAKARAQRRKAVA